MAQAVLETLRGRDEPYYLAIGDEVRLFEAAYAARLPVMLKGPTGCGKTRFVAHMAWRLGRPLVTVACNEEMSASDLVGRYLLEEASTRWQDGPLTQAARVGAICYLDEIVEARQDTLVVIHPLTDDRRLLSLPARSEVLHAHQLACAAHAAAHLTFGAAPFPVGSLKPLARAIVSLLEDARVERLALQRYPGLARLWAPFHTASATGVKTSRALFARLARALFDERFVDGDAWVCKARALFEASRAKWHQPGALRELGSALGNDLGQMRVQFNAADYVVEPPYRDDNTGLWQPQPPPTAPPFEQELEAEAARPATGTSQRQSARSQAAPPPTAAESALERSAPVRDELERARPSPIRYPEWDYVIAQERAEFCSLYEHEAEAGDIARLDAALQAYASTRRALLSSVRYLTARRSRWQRRLLEGNRLDLPATVSHCVARASGARPDPRVYSRARVEREPPAVLLLLDLSQSMNAPAPGAGNSVLGLARDASALLAETLAALSYDLAVHGFDSDSRHDVGYFRFKEFDEPFDDRVRARLAGMSARRSTRLGAALRHAGVALERRAAQRKLLLVVTDGEPSDVDIPDRKYLVQDAKHAALRNNRRGIHGFCVALDCGAEPAVRTMFGAGNYLVLAQLEALPRKLSQLCVRLSPV